MALRAVLTGDPLDLDQLTELFPPGSDPSVQREGDVYYMISASVLPEDMLNRDHVAIRTTATELLELVNGEARRHDIAFRPVTITGRFWGPSGSLHSVAITDTVLGRGRVPIPRNMPSPAPGHIALAQQDPDVRDVLALLAKPEPAPDWFDLYKVYEIVTDNLVQRAAADGMKVAHSQTLVDAGWVTDEERRAFTGSANHQGATGPAARHARLRGAPPKQVMTMIDARALIQRVVTAWLDSTPQPGERTL